MSQMQSPEERLEFDEIDRLAKSLRVSGMKPGDMARALDVHRNTVGNYLNGRTKLDRRTRIAWAFATGVPIEWLENGKTPAGPEGPDGGQDVRHQGLEPRTRWFEAFCADQYEPADVVPLRRAA